MKIKRITTYLFIVLVSLIIAGFSLASNENDPWKRVFNGKDFTGWSKVGNFGKAWIEDGTIVTHMVSRTPEHTFLRTNKKYKDFILEWKP